jgi:hypothetical protein
LDSVIPAIRYVNVAVRRDDQAVNVAELALGLAERAPLPEEGTSRREVLNAAVERVGDVNGTVRTHLGATQLFELAVAFAEPAPPAGVYVNRLEFFLRRRNGPKTPGRKD